MMMIGGNNQVTTQNEGGGGSSAGMNNVGGEGDLTLKKGPWTAAEDAVLAEYVRTHGEGNWNAVQKNTGLARCGKSCRLRWANHLRPNLKKGTFSPEEERIIVELHAKMGNKWARMATQLPGRTDNEIKNYWNTRVKRRQRQGLPLYPPEIQPLYSEHQQNQHHSQPTTPIPSPPTSSFSFQTPTSLHSSMLTAPHTLHIPRSSSQPLLCNPHSAPTPPPLHSPSPASTPPPLPSPSPSTPTHVSPLQSPHKPAFSTLPLFDYSTSNSCNNNTSTTSVTNTTTPSDFFYPRNSPSLQTPLCHKRFRHEGSESNNNNQNMAVNGSSSTSSSFMLPFSPFLKSAIFNPHTATVTTSLLTPPHYPSYSLDPITLDHASSSRILRPHFDSGQFISTPGFVYPLKTELPSNQLLSQDGNSEVAHDTKGNNYSSNDDNYNHHNLSMPICGNGLLEDMLEEAQVLAGNNEIMRRQSCLVGFSSSSEGLASVLKAKEETPEHEDYSRLLNVIPSSMTIPEWYNDSGEGSNGQSSVITDDNLGLEMHHIASLLPVDIAADHGRTPSSRSWDNFPGI
ncbi:hypothetical protein CRYUN_Cryun38cG0066600 [Craigia yunnanensis]